MKQNDSEKKNLKYQEKSRSVKERVKRCKMREDEVWDMSESQHDRGNTKLFSKQANVARRKMEDVKVKINNVR